MSEILIKWLNEEIHLSKQITNISQDFKTGYLFAELLYKTKQLQNLSEYKNTSNKKDIIHNFCLLDQVLLRMGIILKEKDRDEMINESIYTSKIYLLKIRQYLAQKCINIEQLNHKYSNDLQKLYNSYIFKNKNQKYLYNLKVRIENEKNNINKASNNTRALTERNIKEKNENKFDLGGPLYVQLKKKYSHLNLTDFELGIILSEMKEQEKKYQILKQSIKATESKRKKNCQKKENQEINVWKSSIININNFKKDVMTELWKPVLKQKNNFKIYMKKQISDNIIRTENFDKNLNVFVTGGNKEKGNTEDENEEEENEENDNMLELQKKLQMKNEVYMSQIKERLQQKIKSKKDREKRERKRLREEREMFERINTEKNMQDMISKMEINLNRNKIPQLEEEENINIDYTNELLNSISPIEKQRLQNNDILILKELNKQNKIDEENNENERQKQHKIDMNITRVIKKIKLNEKEKVKEKEKEIENNEIKEVPENNEINEVKEEKKEKKEIIDDDNKSSYSKLSSNDYGLNLMNEAFEIHNVNKKDKYNKMNLFKTRLLFSEDSEQKYNNLPNIFNVEEEQDKKSKELNNNKTPIKKEEENLSKNVSEIFDKDLFYEEMDKLNYENFVKESTKRRIKKQKKINIIKPVLNKILEITDYIFEYQHNNNVEIIENIIWDELMLKFKNWEDIKEKEEEIIEDENELSEYLCDYGDKLENNDSLIIFDYANYLNIFNDLIIPDNERGKKFKYCELYEEFYGDNQDVNIKDYEPKEEELENLVLPKYPNFINNKFFEIIENSFKHKYNNKEKSIIPQNNTEIFTKKGKYFYIPIKMSFIGYPLSGKKIQGNLISTKYPKIKLFNPEEILENKLEEYKQLKEPVEKSSKNKNLKPNQLEQLNKEREEKLEQFKPILDIIQPYLDYIEQNNNSNDTNNNINLNLHETNLKEDILTDVYINLLIYELDLAFPNNVESKNNLMEEIKNNYKEYLSIKEQIEEINKKEEESLKENEANKNKKISQNFAKDLDILNKKLESIISELYIGFIFINFPKNEKQAKKLENKISGFISIFEQQKDELTQKIFSYDNLLDINIKQNNKNIKQISIFDSFINLNITSEEVDRRFKLAKYDPSTNKIYNMEQNPPSDKKILEKLLPGVPGMDEKKLNEEKIIFEKSKSSLCSFYKMMSNGFDKIYKNVEQMDKSYNNNINNDIENSMKKIFENYYKNLDLINNIIINDSKNLENSIEINNDNIINNQEKEKAQDQEENINTPKKEEQKESEEGIEKNNEQINNEQTKINNINNSEKSQKENSNQKETEINLDIYNPSEDISNNFEQFASDYQNTLKNFIHFLSRQKYHIEFYLTKIQNDFILYLNRKTDKINIIEMYSNKYNSIITTKPLLLENQKVIDELHNDIEDVAKSIWLIIQNKKNEDIKYLTDLKENKILNSEVEKFWEFALKIVENEVKKYLVTCEIIIKYYLNQTGYLSELLENNKNKSDNFLFKIDYLKYLFQGFNKSDIFNNMNLYEEENKEEIKEENLNIQKEENQTKNQKDASNEDNNKSEDNKSLIEEKDKHNETKSNLNETNKISHSSKQKNNNLIEDNIQILFINALKIIIRQDLLMKQYKEKIKNYNYQDNSKNKISINKLNSSIISSTSKKSRMKNKSLFDEEFSNQIKIEKDKFKYRLMFLKYYIIKYFKIIVECFNTTYNAMDDWIITSVKKQNDSLNNFVDYLKKILIKNKKNRKIDLDDFEFDNFNIYRKYKVDISLILDKMKLNSYISSNKSLNNKEDKAQLIFSNINDMSLSDKFVYNINDLIQIYKYLKSFGIEGCDHLINYEIVKEILVHKYFSKKKYTYQSNINNNPINSMNDDKSNNKIIKEENNGIPLAVKFLSNVNYINCLNNFSEYQNNYININDLFICLILLGSEIISSDKFLESIKEKTDNGNKMYLTKEEFLDLNLWFDEDKYLNAFADMKEEKLYNNDKNKENKIQKIKSSIFDIYEEEGKICLNKLVNLLNKFDKSKNEEKSNEEIDQTKINQEINKNENINELTQMQVKEKEQENNENKDMEENKEQKEENKEENNEENNNNNENTQNNEEIDIKLNLNNDKDFKESIKNDDISSPRNESEFFSSSIKQFKNTDELKNNFFNGIFYNQQF